MAELDKNRSFSTELGVMDKLVHEVSTNDFALRLVACKRGMELRISAIPYALGKFLAPARLPEIFARLSIAGMIDQEALNQFCQDINLGEVRESVVVVRGKDPENGEDQKVKFYAKPSSTGAPATEAFDDQKDYHNLNLFENVKKNQLLAEVIPATEGISGRTVLGEYVEAVPGEVFKQQMRGESNVFADSSGLKFYAKVDGRIIYDRSRKVLSVSDVYIIKGNVDYTTGDIDFIGGVEVFGDVTDTYNIKAGKWIKIHKHVGNCKLESGGDIEMHGMDSVEGGSIRSKGDVKCKYIHSVNVESEGNIIIATEAVNCQLHSEKSILARTGAIIGGEAVALKGFEVQSIGSDANVKTHLISGVSYIMQEAIKDLREQLSEFKEKMNFLSKKLDPFVINPRSLLSLNNEGRAKVKEMAAELKGISVDKEALENELKQLSKEAQHGANPMISVIKCIEAEVVLTIGTSTEQFKDRVIGQRSYIENSVHGGLRPVPYYPLDKSARDIEYAIVRELKKQKDRESS